VSQTPDLIVTLTWYVVGSLKEVTNTIPIVAMVNDPVAAGLADSLARSGSNVTGVVVDPGMEVWRSDSNSCARLLQLHRMWASSHPSLLGNIPTGLPCGRPAQKLGISLSLAEVERSAQEHELRRAFAALRQRPVDALVFHEGPNLSTQRALIAQLAQELRVPTVYPVREFTELGGLITYSVDYSDLWRHAARQADQILKGDKPRRDPRFPAFDGREKAQAWVDAPDVKETNALRVKTTNSRAFMVEGSAN